MQTDIHAHPTSQTTDLVQPQLDRLATLVRDIEAECVQAAPTAKHSVLAQQRATMLDAMHALGGAINTYHPDRMAVGVAFALP